jgi:hypothetical protein
MCVPAFIIAAGEWGGHSSMLLNSLAITLAKALAA